MSANIIRLLPDQEQARMKKTPEERKLIIRPEDLSDEHINHRRRFAGLPQENAEELKRWRGYLRWMRSRFAPDPHPDSDKPPQDVWPEDNERCPRPESDSHETADGKLQDPSSRDLIYGEVMRGLVFMERSKALENIAFRAAVTWGDFRKGAPTLYERALADLDAEENPPPDTQELDHDALDGDGDFHYFPEQLMLDFIPELVQERYGSVEETRFNGPMLTLDPDHESTIVAVLRNRGFSVQRNDALLEALYA